MNQPAPFEWPSFLGGVNQEVPASSIGPKDVSMAVNFKPSVEGIRSRGGLRRLFQFRAPNGAPEPVCGLQTAARGGSRGLLVLGQVNSAWYPRDYANPTYLGTIGDSQSLIPWSISPWNDAVFFARDDDGLQIAQLSPDFAGPAGAERPTVAISAADNGAGDLTAGAYLYAEAFKDSRIGTVSSRGPTTSVTIGASRSVLLDDFTTPPETRFDLRVLYRSLPNGTGALYKIDEIPVADTSYVDNIPIIEQGEAAIEEDSTPPDDVRSVAQFNARLWVTDGRLMYPSEILNPEAFLIRRALEVGQDDNEEIVEFVALKTRIVVGKRGSLWSITGTGPTSFAVDRIDPDHGVVARRGMVAVNGGVAFLSDDDPYFTDGVRPAVPLSGAGYRKLKPFFEARTGTDPLVCVPVPKSDGVIFGMNSRVVSREVIPVEQEAPIP